jgi:simple sugar transport system permease protein
VGAIAGALMALIHAFLVISLRSNQIVSGLALTIFAAGLSSYLANDLHLANAPAEHTFTAFLPHGLCTAPVVGPILFDQTALVYISWICVVVVALYLAPHRPEPERARGRREPGGGGRDRDRSVSLYR